MYYQKSLLFNNSDIWTKKEGNKDFDVTIGSFDDALYFIYMKYQIWNKF